VLRGTVRRSLHDVSESELRLLVKGVGSGEGGEAATVATREGQLDHAEVMKARQL
jgi:hypothetical protein